MPSLPHLLARAVSFDFCEAMALLLSDIWHLPEKTDLPISYLAESIMAEAEADVPFFGGRGGAEGPVPEPMAAPVTSAPRMTDTSICFIFRWWV